MLKANVAIGTAPKHAALVPLEHWQFELAPYDALLRDVYYQGCGTVCGTVCCAGALGLSIAAAGLAALCARESRSQRSRSQ